MTLQEIVAEPLEVDIVVGWCSFTGTQIGETNYSYQIGSKPAFQRGVVIRIEDPTALSLDPIDGAFYQGTSTTLRQSALHEFGHALGLGRSTDPHSVCLSHLAAEALVGLAGAGLAALKQQG